MRQAALSAVVAALACTSLAGAAGPVLVTVSAQPAPPVVGRTWTLRLSVRPASFAGAVEVTAAGPRRLEARAAGRHGSYRARFVFPSAGRWTLRARAGGSTSGLGSVQVRPAPAQPLVFTEPTSIDLEPSGTLLLVENDPGRLLRVDPRRGVVTTVVASTPRPYAVVRAPSGAIFFSGDGALHRVDPSGAVATVASAGADVGPIAAAPDGNVYYATATQIFRLTGGSGRPVRIAGTGVEGGGGDGGPALDAQFSAPHGLALARDGSLLVADAGNDRIRRIDLAAGVVSAFAPVGTPHGIDIAADGTVYVVDSRANRVVHLAASGERLGAVGPVFALPYDVEVAADGVVYVLEAGPFGRVRRIAPDGTVTTVSRPR